MGFRLRAEVLSHASTGSGRVLEAAVLLPFRERKQAGRLGRLVKPRVGIVPTSQGLAERIQQ